MSKIPICYSTENTSAVICNLILEIHQIFVTIFHRHVYQEFNIIKCTNREMVQNNGKFMVVIPTSISVRKVTKASYHAVFCRAMDIDERSRFARLSVSIDSAGAAGASTTKSRRPYHRTRQCARDGKSLSVDARSSHNAGITSPEKTHIDIW